MESKKTKELRSRKLSVRSKLMAAVAMLLVSTIMLSSTTYAWFVLSTAPEVKGMSTTVGSNGSLEIALLNDETGADPRQITSGIGDSTVITGDAARSNIHWGNIVDLSSTAYGLESIRLYPAALNLNPEDNTKLTNVYSALKYPAYGADGRIALLSADTASGRYNEGVFKANNAHRGVRVVGTVENANPLEYSFTNAQINLARNLNNAKNAAKASLDTYGTALTNMVIKHGMDEENTATFSATEVQNITDAVASFNTVADYLKKAIQYAYEAHYISTNNANLPTDVTTTDLATIKAVPAFTGYVTAYEAFVAAIGGVTVPGTGSGAEGAYLWSDINTAMRALIDSDGLTVGGHTVAEIKPAAKHWQAGTASEEELALINSLMGGVISVVVKDGLYSGVANFTDAYTSDEVQLNIMGLRPRATITAQKADTVTTAYGVAAGNTVAGLPAPGGTSANIITTTYGYMIDLAFRSNAATDLRLSAATQRVKDDADTMGAGSTFNMTSTLSAADVAKIGNALRVVFVDPNDYAILGVAGLTATGTPLTPTADGKYALHMYNYSVVGGSIVLGTQKDPETVTSLTANTTKCITALVYLDGNFMDYALNEDVAGTLNLQFDNSVDLRPMDYSGYVTNTTPAPTPTLAISSEGDADSVAAGSNLTLTAKYGGEAITGTVTWTSDSANATVVAGESGTATVRGVTAGTATITAKYTPAGGTEQTATFDITVTSAG